MISGCPGSGKSHLAERQAAEIGALAIRTTFHSETSYFDFIGSFRPAPVYDPSAQGLVDAGGGSFGRGRPLIDYRFVPGPFTEALLAARLDGARRVVLLIEELNRANCGAVFGDMFQLLDRDASGISRYGISATAELNDYFKASGSPLDGPLRLPENLSIWATMNSADQGVQPLDTAFRRRWAFEYLGHATVCDYEPANRQMLYGGGRVDWEIFRAKVNEHLIAHEVHEDKLIGPYFLSPEELAEPNQILHKLFLYLWEDALRFRHDSLMPFKSFSELSLKWSNGAGSPLTIVFAKLDDAHGD